MRPRQIARREFAYTRQGTVTFLAALNVDDGTMWGCCLEANDPAHFLAALGRLIRRYPRAQRRHVILDNGSSHIAQATNAYVASHPRLRAFYTPPHASWLNQAAWLRCAFSDKYLQRFDALARQPLIDHLEASWPAYHRRCAHPFTWSGSCRAVYAWARKKATGICTKTYATRH
jgi:DDE superfamily endonuclease